MVISIDKVQEGMVLAQDVLLPSGMILINCNRMLDTHLIDMIRRRGIMEIHVIEPEDEPRQAEPPKQEDPPANTPQSDASAVAAAAVPSPEEKPKPTLPRVIIVLSPDRLSAELRIESAGGKDELLAFDDVMTEFEMKGVVYGIDENKVASCVDRWNRTRKPVRDIVAQGTPIQRGKEGDVAVVVKHLSDAVHCGAVRGVTHFWETGAIGSLIERINPGTVIAERQSGLPPMSGKTVTGEVLPCEDLEKCPVRLDEKTVRLSHDGKQMTAAISGVCFFTDNLLGVVPLDFSGSAEIVLAPNRLAAVVVVHPAGPGGALPTKKDIEVLLAKNGISFGLQEAAARTLYDCLSRGECPAGPVTIASGIPAQNGENGRVEYLFDTETSLKPKTNPDGSVDFKSLGIIHSVVKGQELARLVPPTKGKPGKDVTGKELPSRDGVPAIMPAGINTKIPEDRPGVLIAETDGYVKIKGNVIEIQEGYVIGGDVGYETGNINYAKSVQVKGDIKGGFIVECGGDLEVGGTIEDCHVIVGGNVLCKHGYLGTGKGIIEAKGDVNIGFMKNQTIKSRHNVSIAKEALNVTIFAKNAIAVHGNPLSVAGGHLMARDSITVHTAGNASQIKTTLEVGADFTLIEEMQKTEKQILEITENRQKIIDTIKKFDHLITIKRKLPPKEEFLYTKLKNTFLRYDQQLHELENRKKMITAKMQETEQAFIRIEHGAMPGTVFKIGDRYFLVREEVIGPKNVRLIRGEIRIL